VQSSRPARYFLQRTLKPDCGYFRKLQPYTSPPGTEVRDLGPPIDLTTFPSALYYSER